MNKILKEKINIHLINIIREYLLPIVNKNKNTKNLKELISKTWNILYNLNTNSCLDKKFYIDCLKNIKIQRIFIIYANTYFRNIRKFKPLIN